MVVLKKRLIDIVRINPNVRSNVLHYSNSQLAWKHCNAVIKMLWI